MSRIAYIKAGDTERPFSFGMAALDQLLKTEGLTLQELGSLGENMQISTMINIVLIGLRDGARRTKAAFDLSFEDVADMIDENPELLNGALTAYADALSPGEAQQPEKKIQRLRAK